MAKSPFDFKLPKGLFDYNQTEKVERIPLRKTEKDYQFLHKQKGKCALCGIDMVEKGIVPPDFHHKDGNPANNSPENIIAICPNCHRKETFKQWYNKGQGKPKPEEGPKPTGIDLGKSPFEISPLDIKWDAKSLFGS